VSDESSERPAGVWSRRRAAGAIPSGLADASPTWELELLLSGAVLVALFQVSGVVDRAFERIAPHVGMVGFVATFMVYLYGKGVVIALIATFVLHLAARGYWVGLVGLNSVFPNGVKWDQLTYGPLTREVIRERLPSLPPIIARLDNFCSTLFSFGFLLVLLFAISLVGAVGVIGVTHGISLLFFGGRATLRVLSVVAALLLVVSLAPPALDRLFGARWDPGSRRGRVLRRAARFHYVASALPILGPVLLTLQSNTRRRAFTVVLYLASTAIFLYVTARVVAVRADLELNTYAYFAKPDGYSVNARYYESHRRRGQAFPQVPTIQSDIIRDPFVKLFIPFQVERHETAIAERCPDARPINELGIQIERPDDVVPDSGVAAVLRCMSALHPVTLNGAQLTNVEFRFYENPANSLRGVIAYIPTTGLPRGRNVLTIERAPRERSARPARTRPPHLIPFWL
jgi:hypothetical protein